MILAAWVIPNLATVVEESLKGLDHSVLRLTVSSMLLGKIACPIGLPDQLPGIHQATAPVGDANVGRYGPARPRLCFNARANAFRCLLGGSKARLQLFATCKSPGVQASGGSGFRWNRQVARSRRFRPFSSSLSNIQQKFDDLSLGAL